MAAETLCVCFTDAEDACELAALWLPTINVVADWLTWPADAVTAIWPLAAVTLCVCLIVAVLVVVATFAVEGKTRCVCLIAAELDTVPTVDPGAVIKFADGPPDPTSKTRKRAIYAAGKICHGFADRLQISESVKARDQTAAT